MNPIQKISHAEVEKSAIEKYTLSINLRIDGLSFLIQNQEGKNIHMEAFEWLNVKDWGKSIANLSKLLKEHELLSLTYVKPVIYIQSTDCMLVPEKFFLKTKMDKLYHQYFAINTHKVYSSKLLDFNLLFGIDERIAKIITSKWKDARWSHLSYSFIEKSLKQCKQGQEIVLKFENGYFEVLASNNQKLEAHNYFSFSGSEEFLFNLLSFSKQIGFDVSTMKLSICGKIVPSSPLHLLLEKYIPNVVFLQTKLDKESVFQELIQASNANR